MVFVLLGHLTNADVKARVASALLFGACASGNVEDVHLLLTEYGVDPNTHVAGNVCFILSNWYFLQFDVL